MKSLNKDKQRILKQTMFSEQQGWVEPGGTDNLGKLHIQ